MPLQSPVPCGMPCLPPVGTRPASPGPSQPTTRACAPTSAPRHRGRCTLHAAAAPCQMIKIAAPSPHPKTPLQRPARRIRARTKIIPASPCPIALSQITLNRPSRRIRRQIRITSASPCPITLSQITPASPPEAHSNPNHLCHCITLLIWDGVMGPIPFGHCRPCELGSVPALKRLPYQAFLRSGGVFITKTP